MGSPAWRRALVLGGTRSGKSEFAERLLADEPTVRYVATARSSADPEWARRIDAHRARRPGAWTTAEVGTEPSRLAPLLAGAGPDDAILVDEIGTWVGGLLTPVDDATPDADASLPRMADELGAAVRACPARLVLVSPEVGLAPVALTPMGRAFVDALGATNIALAAACDAVVLVVAGYPVPVKGEL
jgi:adenosyl cobinamide kinase/adenosyl cobinamide phosphate guanylyltransferase